MIDSEFIGVWFKSLQKHQIWQNISEVITFQFFKGVKNLHSRSALKRNFILASSYVQDELFFNHSN